MHYAILTAALILVDQVVKYFTRANIPLHKSVPFIPHLFDLTYVQNTGAAFSIFSDHTWLLTIISALVTIALVIILFKRVITDTFAVLSLSVVLAGAVGNLIDRALFGFVTDMFQFLPFRFAIFNVADICVVLGGIAFSIYLIFLDGNHEKQGASQ